MSNNSTHNESQSTQAPIQRGDRLVDQAEFLAKLDALIAECGGDPASRDGGLIREQLATSLKTIYDGRETAELRLMTGALKELRYAYTVFEPHDDCHKVSIFGSARTPEDDPDYIACVNFSKRIAQEGWQVITGAGDGIMKAGHEGPGAESSFGLAIRLPFETTANEVIAGDDKLINFRYFFTRKLIFVSQSEAVVVFPGGFGTQDELYESLTLIQTGKSPIVPVVLMEHEGGSYWEHWQNYAEKSLLGAKLISPEDMNLYHITSNIDEAVAHVTQFYKNYHSSRYFKDDLIIRLNGKLREEDVQELSKEFVVLIKPGGSYDGQMVLRGAYDVEQEHLELPRLCFTHIKSKFGLVRKLIDRINELETVS